MTNDELLDEISRLRFRENVMNIRLGIIDKQIKQLKKEKKSIAKKISKNMKHRNVLISQLNRTSIKGEVTN